MTIYAAAHMLCADVPAEEPAWVEVEGSRVLACGTGARGDATDLGDGLLAPAFIDMQVNGFGPHDVATGNVDDIVALVEGAASGGTLACCPTICTAPLDAYDAMLARVCEAQARTVGIIGVHLEGPFLGGAPGAHPVDLIRRVDLDWLRSLVSRFGDLLRVVTLAPEADPGCEATKLLVANGVTVALGHSVAAYDEVHAFAAAGASVVTHLFNGMNALHHRAPGVPGAALDDPRLTPSLIADFVHVHPALVRLAARARPDLVLVSDAVAVDGVSVIERDGAAYLPDGTLAGSTLTMERAVQNVAGLGVPIEVAVAMASTNPARVLGLADRGRIAVGARADFVVLDPVTFAVRNVFAS